MQRIDRFGAGRQRLYRVAQQGGQGDAVVLALLFEQRQLPFLGRHQAALLGQLQASSGACALAALDQAQHIACVAQVKAGDAQLLFQGQALQVAVGNAADQGQLDRLALETAGIKAEATVRP